MLGLLMAGCGTTGVSARIQEKSAVYASLKTWEKRCVDHGVIALGFSPDMVYLAIGHPSRVDPGELSSAGPGELWVYRNYFPTPDAVSAHYSAFTSEAAFQPATHSGTEGLGVNGAPAISKSAAMAGGRAITDMRAPQGGSLEPSDLQAFTLLVLFHDGRVTRIGIKPN